MGLRWPIMDLKDTKLITFYTSSIPLQVLFYASPLNQKHEFHFSEILALEVKSNLPSLTKETKTVLKI